MNRRDFLRTSAASVLATTLSPRPVWASSMPELVAAPDTAPIVSPDVPVRVWGYNGSTPGPEIRVRAGERIRRRLVNRLPQPTAVHWHGIRIANAMDGAVGLTQAPVPSGETFDYDFVAPDPGTYWYHAHNRSWEQVARGLVGPLIVEDTEPWQGLPGAAVREIALVLDDWYLNVAGQIDEPSFGNLHEWAHAGRVGNVATVNGRVEPQIAVHPGERLRVRLINTANARMMQPQIGDGKATLIALDGHPVPPRDPGDLVLMPAQRADLVIDVPADGATSIPVRLLLGGDDVMDIAHLVPDGSRRAARVTGDVRPLPAWASARDRTPDLKNAHPVTLRMEGGAMGNLISASVGGRKLSFEELGGAKKIWAFNGVAGGASVDGYGEDPPIFSVPRGTTVRLTVANETGFAHGIHLHGHHFTLLTEPQGLSAGLGGDRKGDVRDTLSTWPGERTDVAFVADNPGRWMLHCHMLEHQAAGMLGWFEVT